MIKGNEKIADKLVKEYLEKWASIYKDFSLGVELILKAILINSSTGKHQTFCREKNYEKLREKIIKNGYTKLEEVKDLAGCRVLFYVQEDIKLFKKYLFEEFNIVESTLHYPFSNTSENKVYYAEHFYIKLKNNRSKKPEYVRFKNLLCEIQLATILYHSSAELEHDISYKPPKMVGVFYKEELNILKNRFASVLIKYIKPAQNELDSIWKKFNMISEGKRMFGHAFTRNMLNPKSINELYSDLSFLKSKIELFNGKIPDNIDIFKIIQNSLAVSKNFKIANVKTPFGELRGHGYDDILSLCLEIINYLKFQYPEEFINLLVEIFEQQKNNQRKGVVDALSAFSKNNYSILQKIGYKPKEFILDRMEKWNEDELLKRLEIILEISKNLLNPSFEGTSMKDYKTMIFSSGPLNATKELANIRNRTLKLLKKLYSVVNKQDQKKAILSVMETASHTPHQGVYGEDMEVMVLENTKTIVDFFIKLLPKAENEIISNIEEQINWFSRRFKDEKLPEVKNLKEKIDQNEEYKIYRLFVGYEDRFSEKLSWEGREKRRNDKVQEIVADIKEENFEIWEKRIFDIIKNYSASDSGGYQYFNVFLNELAKQKPRFALKLLGKDKKIPFPFLVALVSGILKSSNNEKGKEIIKGWIKKGANLDICANAFSYDVEVDKEIISLLFKKAKGNKDIGALDGIIKILANNYPKYKNKKIFIDVLKELTKLKDCSWVNDGWYQKNSILDSLNSNDRKAMLDNLLFSSNVSHYHIEEILAFIAKDNPKLITDFFYNRIKLKEKKKRETSYDAIPFNLHVLGEALAKDGNAVIVIKEILKWFDEKEWFFSWDAGSLLQAIFPVFDEKLETTLLKLIKKGGKHNAKIVISILDKYDGQIFLHKVCQEFIKKYQGKKEYINSIIHALSKTGTVMGEYGFVNAYKKKKEEIQGWKKNKNKKIISFVKDYEDYLDKQIEYEQKRADEQIELMKRNCQYC